MIRLEQTVFCDVCHQRTVEVYANETRLGRDDMFCRYCFQAWYEAGLVNESEIRRASLRARYAEVN